ncbi:MAG: (Fe-S)-binding protein [Pseudomonadota bacterium]
METVAPLAEITQEIRKAGGEAFKYCYQCGKCDVVCPWNRVRDFSIRRIVREASYGLAEIELEDVWRCTTCGTCPAQCPRGVEQIEVGVAIRRVAAEYDVFPGSARGVRSAAASLGTQGNPLNEEREQRDAWAAGLDVKPFTDDMELLYFVGCYYSYDPRMRKVARATVELLHKAGVSFGILGNQENCCGESIRKTGNEAVFRNLAKDNIKTFIDRGVKKILVSSPHCLHTFKNEYPEFMVHFEVVHMTELLAELLASGRLKLAGEFPRTVTYHDPCYLGRHNKVFDAPRAVLDAVPGLQRREMRDHHENSLCCGGGGGRIWMETPKQERFSNLRIAQAKQVGAEVLVTSCPYCISMFEEARLSLAEDDPLQIQDITEVLQAALEVRP